MLFNQLRPGWLPVILTSSSLLCGYQSFSRLVFSLFTDIGSEHYLKKSYKALGNNDFESEEKKNTGEHEATTVSK